MDLWFDNVSLATSFSMLFELAENKLATVDMFLLGWEGDGRGVEVEETICVGGRVGW